MSFNYSISFLGEWKICLLNVRDIIKLVLEYVNNLNKFLVLFFHDKNYGEIDF